MTALWTRLVSWWENKKGVLLDFVLPTLDKAIPDISGFLQSKGLSKSLADSLAWEVVAWVKEYLKRQL
jgi:hypothetical protein